MSATEKNITELIHNPEFVQWVLKPNARSNQFWGNWIDENPLQKIEFEQARFILKSLVKDEKSLTESEISELWESIELSQNKVSKRIIRLKKWAAAAGILLILGFSGWLMVQLYGSKKTDIDYHSIAVNIDSGNDIKLILADHSQKKFTNKEVEFKYNQSGKLETKEGKQVQTEDLVKSSEGLQMNQLIVPRGKRSNIELADGTKLWLNSGSRAIYPVAFNGKTREIYIEGEGYLEVAHNVTKPFIVITDQVKVKVLGTKFNISAYKDDCGISVVLVEGSIEALCGSDDVIMKPNELLNYKKLTHESTLEETNILPFISWKDGWMLCNKEPIHSLTRKLSRYYDLTISYTDPRVNNMTITGKLDLKSKCEDVLKIICATAPLKYEIIGDTIFLTVKEKK